MNYIVYETTNTVNGKIYIGVHNGKNPDYLGSGIALNNAIAKYGKENFTRRTIETNTADKCYELENLIVDEEFVANRNTYNLMIGGLGCGGHSDETKAKVSEAHKGKFVTDETKAKMSEAKKGKVLTDETRARLAVAHANIPKKQCPHCLRWFKPAIFARWHGDKCKSLK